MKLFLGLLAVVWAVDDGEKIARDEAAPPFAQGVDNPVWQPGGPIALFALRQEVVAFQVVVAGPAEGVSVEVEGLADGIGVERFVEHFFEVRRSSAGGREASLGWAEGSGPAPGRYTGFYPDALIPVELAPAWSPWPMTVAKGQNGVVWIDLTVPRDQAPGVYRGQVRVRAGTELLATLPLELEVRAATLPARPVATMLHYSRDSLARRIGNTDETERQLQRLLHRHRLTPLHTVRSVEDVRAQLPALDGSLYGDGLGDDIVVLGTYGTFGDPSPDRLAAVERIADELAAHRLFDRAEVLLYAEDEDCASPRGAGWRALLRGSHDPSARRVKVAWTCSEDPARQPVDVPIVAAGEYNPALARGRRVMIYNGRLPATGSMLTDSEAISLRTWGWIAAMAAIPRWFLWETTFWYDGNRGGHGPYDPFVSAETFHNADGEAAMGDGVLLYPGRQLDRPGEHSLGFDGVLPSIRLKNLRRGIEDAGYLQLARASHRQEAERIARGLLPRILAEAQPGTPQSWSPHGKPFFEARRALAQLIEPGRTEDPGPSAPMGAGPVARSRPRLRWRYLAIGLGLALLAIGIMFFRSRRRAPARP